jgi:hypothetical protein
LAVWVAVGISLAAIAVLFLTVVGAFVSENDGSALIEESYQPPPLPPPPDFKTISVEILPFPTWQVENVRFDEGCARLTDYCVRTHCAVRNLSSEAQEGTVVVASFQGNRTYTREKLLSLRPQEVAYLTENFDEAVMVGAGSTYSGNCIVRHKGARETCVVANVGGPGTALVSMKAYFPDGTAEEEIKELRLGAGERGTSIHWFQRADAIRGECEARAR